MPKGLRKYFCLAVLLALLGGCCSSSPQGQDPDLNTLPGGGTETGNPATGNVLIFAYSASELRNEGTGGLMSLVPTRLSLDSLSIEEAFVTISGGEFRKEGSCSNSGMGEDAITFEGLIVQDLLKMGAEERGSGQNADHEPYCKITLQFGPALDDTPGVDQASESMVGKSFLVTGRKGGQRVVVETGIAWQTTFTPTAQAERIDFQKNADYLMVGFDLDQWFRGIEIPDMGASEVRINDSNEPGLIDQVISNVFGSIDIFIDADGDATLDLAELESPIASVESEAITVCGVPFDPNHPPTETCHRPISQ